MKCVAGYAVVLAGAAVACGGRRNDEASDASSADASSAETALPDAVAPCDPNAPFGPLVREDALSTPYAEEAARFSPDGREAFVSRRTQPNIVETFRYVRSTPDAPWALVGPETALALFPDGGLTTATSLTFASDPLVVVLQYYDVPGSPMGSIARSQRSAVGAAWSLPAPVPGLESVYEDNTPTLSQDGMTIYWFNNRAGSWRINVAKRKGDGFGDVAFVGPLDPVEETHPVPSADERTLYFATKAGDGTRRVRRSRRATTSATFGAGEAVPELDGLPGQPTAPTWLSPDGCRIVLLAQRGGVSIDVFSATKP